MALSIFSQFACTLVHIHCATIGYGSELFPLFHFLSLYVKMPFPINYFGAVAVAVVIAVQHSVAFNKTRNTWIRTLTAALCNDGLLICASSLFYLILLCFFLFVSFQKMKTRVKRLFQFCAINDGLRYTECLLVDLKLKGKKIATFLPCALCIFVRMM